MNVRVVVVGGGIAGVTVAERLSTRTRRSARRRRDHRRAPRRRRPARGQARDATPFAGRPAVDEGADAFLARVPHASELAARVGSDRSLTSPERPRPPSCGTAGSTRSPTGWCSVCPAGADRARHEPAAQRARQRLRAAVEPLLPRRRDPGTRSARWSAAASATRSTSGSSTRSSGASTAPTPTASAWRWCPSSPRWPPWAQPAARRPPSRADRANAATGPVFDAPRGGHGQQLADGRRRRPPRPAASRSRGRTVHDRRRRRRRWRVDGEPADAVVLATPAAATAPLIGGAAADLAACLGGDGPRRSSPSSPSPSTASWPDRLRGHSGYLVPKPVQTAGHGGVVRLAEVGPLAAGATAGRSCGCRSDATACPSTTSTTTALVDRAVDEVGRHLGLDVQPDRRAGHPVAARRSRSTAPPPRWLAGVDAATPPGSVPHRRQLPRHRCAGVHRRRRAHRRRRRSPSSRQPRSSHPSDPVAPSVAADPRRRVMRTQPENVAAALGLVVGACVAGAAVHAAGDHRASAPPSSPPRHACRRTAAGLRDRGHVAGRADHHDDARPTATTDPAATTTTTTLPPLPIPVPPPLDNEPEPQQYFGRIQIPAIDVDSPLLEGIRLSARSTTAPATGRARRCPASSATSSSPATAPATTPTSAASTSCEPGDEVIFDLDNSDEHPDGDVAEPDAVQRRLRVPRHLGRDRVPPDGIWIVNQDYRHEATLFACHPPGSVSERIVVHLDLVSVNGEPAPVPPDPPRTATTLATETTAARVTSRCSARRSSRGRPHGRAVAAAVGVVAALASSASPCSSGASTSYVTPSAGASASASCSPSSGWPSARRGCGS